MAEHTEFKARRNRLAVKVREDRIDAVLITALPNVRYLSGFTGSNAALLLTRDRAMLFTDPRYGAQAPRESDCQVKVARRHLLKEACASINRLGLRTVGYERNRISLQAFEQLKEYGEKLKLKPLDGAVEALRTVKSEGEIASIRASVQLNSAALAEALGQFKSGMTEVDLAAEIDYRMRRLGAEGTAFETIVASGEHAAMPHARPGGQAIEANQLLLIDMGASVAGYASDMTRTFAVGKLDGRKRQMYKAVLQSQMAAIAAIKPGLTCAKLDREARSTLAGFGMDKLFVHSTGHGLGLEIHEQPRIGKKEKVKLEAGMVITIEPGVYQEGLAGVRIEDTVLVTASGSEILTPTRKDLIVL